MKTHRTNQLVGAFLSAGLATAIPFATAAEASSKDERPVIGIQHEGPVKVVMQVKTGAMSNGVHKGLFRLRKFAQGYLDAGMDAENLDIHAVFHGDAANHLLTDEAWNRYRKSDSGNPSTGLLAEMEDMGVHVELCNNRRLKNEWAKEDLHSSVAFASNAYHRIVDLELRGYAYLRL